MEHNQTIGVIVTESAIPEVDPYLLFIQLRKERGAGNVCLLESLAGPKRDVRTSYVGFDPVFSVSIRGERVEFGGVLRVVEHVREFALSRGVVEKDGDWLSMGSMDKVWDLLRAIRDAFAVETTIDAQSFSFGYFGFVGYRTAWAIEKLPSIIPRDPDTTDMEFVIYSRMIEFNLLENRARFLRAEAPGFWAGSDDSLPIPTSEPFVIQTDDEVPRPTAVSDSIDVGRYYTAVERALEYIRAGDIYQVQLGHEIKIRSEVDPLQVYARLRKRNPSPYSYFAPFKNFTLIGTSPELYVRLEHGQILMRPIAGTARRGRTPDEDAAIVATLSKDEKELAEHIMLVDLCRNDIGRVCKPGTLNADELLVADAYSHVWHLVSNVIGELDPQYDIFDVIATTFPAGTMTGAPKIRSMEIIEELETSPRGAYAGALGLMDFRGWANLALCIRTANYSSGTYSIRASAGTVADSVPEREWQETLNKLGALYWAITGKEDLHEVAGH